MICWRDGVEKYKFLPFANLASLGPYFIFFPICFPCLTSSFVFPFVSCLTSYFVSCLVVSLLSHPLRSRLLVSELCRPYFALGALAHICKYISALRLLLSSLFLSIHPSFPYYVLSIVNPYTFLSTSTNQPTDSVETWCGHHYKK